ncbi:L-histidine N(alpha)-methyltransferase [Planctomycetota bacterium]|nr:L-histidine N(alpha)-methyltransferase [Planctomycetota bacterium]
MLRVIDYDPHENNPVNEIINCLSTNPKTLPCKYFYDAEGSRIFEQITHLPEYYPTRTEVGILQDNLDDIRHTLGPECMLVELGSGSSTKTELLLMGMDNPTVYVPIDISRDHLVQSSIRIQQDFPEIEVIPIYADFHQPIKLPLPTRNIQKTVIFFPGSTIGNLTPYEASIFMNRLATLGGPNCSVLIGVDLRKDKKILETAYNDEDKITEAFNLNMLKHINTKVGSNFNPNLFKHRAIWNDLDGRIEMHLVSTVDQTVFIGEHKISLNKHEHIRTEFSYKYTLDQFATIASAFDVQHVWQDKNNLFSLQYLTRKAQSQTGKIDPLPMRKVS